MPKTKKASGIISTLLAFVLLLGIVGFVAYAAITSSFEFGGKVTFEAEGINATVTAGEQTGCTITKESGDVLSTITYSTDKSVAEDDSDTTEATWDGLIVNITESTGVATFEFTVKNTSSSDILSVTIGEISGSTSDLTIVADPTEATISAGESQTFTITFTVTDPSYNASIDDFSIPIKIEILEEYTVTLSGDFYYAVDGGTTWISSSDAATVTCSKILIRIFGTIYGSVDAAEWEINENEIVYVAEAGFGPTVTGYLVINSRTVSVMDINGDASGNNYDVLLTITSDTSISYSYSSVDETYTLTVTY